MIATQLIISGASGRRIADVITEKPAIENPRKPLKTITNGEVVFDHVSFKYDPSDKHLALDDIDLHIKPGETIGIIGETGSSKHEQLSTVAFDHLKRYYHLVQSSYRSHLAFHE